MTGNRTGDIAMRMPGCGLLRLMTTVVSSGVSTDSTGPNMVLNGWLALFISMENATSDALMASPSWNTALSTRFSVRVSPSLVNSHDSAKYGCGL